MKNMGRNMLVGVGVLVSASLASAQQGRGTIAFTVTMPDAASQLYHVVMQCDGLTGQSIDFKLPVWSPGYYGIMDFARNVQAFKAVDGTGHTLAWDSVSVNDKVSANDWRVRTANAPKVTLTYDVLATTAFVASPFLDASHGFVIGTGVFMYPAGLINHPVTVDIEPPAGWRDVATGLDPASPDKPHVYKAPNYDALYDSPILIGNLDSLPAFEVAGKRHEFVAYNMDAQAFDGAQFMGELKAIVQVATQMMGDIPYSHYVFLGYGAGAGGVEHLNSAAVPFHANPAYDQPGPVRNRELGFLAHEYFHTYNVKRIRPIALGPFDYDRENRTHMLWVSEGFTVYYEYMLVARAGLMTLDDLLGSFTKDMNTVENFTGHLYESPIMDSWNTWSVYGFGRGRGAGQGAAGGRAGARARPAPPQPGIPPTGPISKTVSYYNTGPLLGLVLDFAIRHDTKNQKSLDTVMRNLYQKYYKQLNRGWTDEEFQKECEAVAGAPLDEAFQYANTTKEIDYPKYLAYAGLRLDPPVKTNDPFLGAIDEDTAGKVTITAVMEKSPAELAGLRVGDVVESIDGATTPDATLRAHIVTRKPGDVIKVGISRDGHNQTIDVTLAHRMDESYHMTPIDHPDPLQAEILQSWQGNTAK
jgi:predicted metalloprotease with PDZ domain